MSIQISSRRWALGLMAGLLCASAAVAQYPDRPIHFIVPYPPGGATDNLSRTLMPYIAKNLGDDVTIVVNNQPGAAGSIGTRALANAKPDGYTFGLVTMPPVLSVPIERDTGWTWKSFDLLANVVDDPVSFAVSKESGIKSLQDLIELGKRKPGGISVGTTGVGSDDHFLAMVFQRQTGTPIMHVPFKGSADIITALRGGVIDVAAINISETVSLLKGGTPIIALAQGASTRGDMAPDVPTFKELGVDMELSAMRGMAAPKGLPAEVSERLVGAIQKAAADPEFLEKARNQLLQPINYNSPDEFGRRLQALEGDFEQIWKETPWVDK